MLCLRACTVRWHALPHCRTFLPHLFNSTAPSLSFCQADTARVKCRYLVTPDCARGTSKANSTASVTACEGRCAGATQPTAREDALYSPRMKNSMKCNCPFDNFLKDVLSQIISKTCCCSELVQTEQCHLDQAHALPHPATNAATAPSTGFNFSQARSC